MENINLSVLNVKSKSDFDQKRKNKDENRRKIKEQRKNRVKESKAAAEPKPMDKETFMKKKAEEEDKEQMDAKTLLKLGFAEKLQLVKEIGDQIIFDTEKKYRKLNDLLVFTEDPRDVDVVLKAVQ